MPSTSRVSFMLGGAAALASVSVLRYPADAAEFSYKLGVNLASDHPQVLRVTEAAARIKNETGGRLDISVFPNSSLGSDTGMLTQLRSGALELLQIPDSILGNVVPAAGLSAIPFAFETSRAAWAAVDGPMGAYVREAIGAAGLPVVSKTWDVGFKEVVSSRAVMKPEDLKGLKIRITPSPIQVALFKGFGAIPLAISYAEVYSALQTHLADGSESTLTSVKDSRFYEVTKYLNLTRQNWVGMSMIANGGAWGRLPKNLREIAERNFDQAVSQARTEIAEQNATVPADLQGRGMTVSRPDFAAFQSAVAKNGLYAQWRDTYGSTAWNLFERSVGRKLA